MGGLQFEHARRRNRQLQHASGQVNPVHVRAQPIGAGMPWWNSQKAAQKRKVGFAPIDDLFIIVAVGDRAAYDQKQHLAQWIGDLPGLPRVPDRSQMIEQQRN